MTLSLQPIAFQPLRETAASSLPHAAGTLPAAVLVVTVELGFFVHSVQYQVLGQTRDAAKEQAVAPSSSRCTL